MKPLLRPTALFVLMALMPAAVLAQGLNMENATADNALRLKLAKEYIALNPTKKALANSVGTLAESSTLKTAFDSVNYPLLDLQAAELMAELFTSTEIKALVDFQKSKVGERILIKMPEYQKIMGSRVQTELRKAYEANLNPLGSLGGQRPAGATPAPVAPDGNLGQGTPIQLPTSR